MISRELVKRMAAESEQMALWASIIHWWELKRMPLSKVKHAGEVQRNYGKCLKQGYCGLCQRHQQRYPDSGCGDDCILFRATGRDCDEPKSLWAECSRAVWGGDKKRWEMAADKMYKTLCDLLETVYL